jgi:hypothetical protein
VYVRVGQISIGNMNISSPVEKCKNCSGGHALLTMVRPPVEQELVGDH